jgi:hypothetical protein
MQPFLLPLCKHIIMHKDSKGNDYLEIGNIRVSLVRSSNRTAAKNWPGCDVIRIQAYRGNANSSLHKGAEFPVNSKNEIVDLVRVLLELHRIK